MHPQRRTMLTLNVIGGAAVLGSYAYNIATHARPGDTLWGGIPESWRTPYAAVMPAAAAGYLALWSLLNFRVDPDQAQVLGRPALPLFNKLLVPILLPSALWMPLTFAYAERPSPGLWAAVRIGLATTGLASIGLVGALAALRPRAPRRHFWLALAGSVAFAVQTAILDAIVWPALFRK